MRIPWRRGQNNQLVSIEATEQGIAIARTVVEKGVQRLVHCDYIDTSAADAQQIDELLADKLAAANLTHLPCNWILDKSLYNLLLVEAPKVPAEEMRDAIRWRVKDMIPFAVDAAVMDTFPLPDDGTRADKKMLYVVVAERKAVESIINRAGNLKLNLKAIDIGELAMRNIAERLGGEERGVGLVRLHAGNGALTLVRGDRLYLSRQFDVAYQGGLLDDLPEEALVLELQRSLDYYERQMGQVPPGTLFIGGENISADKISDPIKNSLQGQVAYLDFAEFLPGADQFDEQLLQLCAGAIGGALRKEGV